MKKITMFTMKSCRYCRAALNWMDELSAENDQYKSLDIEYIDERDNPVLARKYDYYYVPAFYIGGKKMHEGAASLEIIRRIFDTALEI